jgi:hypothetical protein
MNKLVEFVRGMLSRREVVPPATIEELCEEAEALQDLNDRLMKTGQYFKPPRR